MSDYSPCIICGKTFAVASMHVCAGSPETWPVEDWVPSNPAHASPDWKARALAAEAHVQGLSRELGAREASEWPGVVEGWMRRAEKAEQERDEARKLLDDLCEIVVEAPNDPPWADAGLSKFHRIRRWLRERHASWEGWKK